MPDYSYAIFSALLWAASAPIINHGLEKLPQQQRFNWTILGLFFAMLTGALTLLPFLWTIQTPVEINGYLILAGLLTFPIATGTYYLSGIAFSGRMEFASQFSKIKPLLSFLLAIFVLHETTSNQSLISVSLIALGTFIFLWGARTHALSSKAIVLGLLAALFWALGELFMKLGISNNHPVHANLVAIISGLVVFSFIALHSLKSITSKVNIIHTLWPFFLHGIVSFGVAYTMFFYSINQIGLARTVLINAFWPILSLLITAVIRIIRGRPIAIPAVLMVAALMLLSGSLFQIIDT